MARRATGGCTVAESVVLDGEGVSALLLKRTAPACGPAAAASRRTVKVVELLGATDVTPNEDVSVKPLGTVIGVFSDSVLPPELVTVNVFDSAVPTTVVP